MSGQEPSDEVLARVLQGGTVDLSLEDAEVDAVAQYVGELVPGGPEESD